MIVPELDDTDEATRVIEERLYTRYVVPEVSVTVNSVPVALTMYAPLIS